MNLAKLFPAEYRAFYCGPLSICVERFGGINSVSLLDVREFNHKLYPDRFPLPWLERDKKLIMEKPLFSPGIQFRHGREFYVPENAELYPFGFRSPHYSLACASSSAAFKFSAECGEIFSMTLSNRHLVQGQFLSLKNHLAVVASGIQWLPDNLRGPGFDPKLPFAENGLTFRRQAPQFSGHQIIFEAECQYWDHTKKQFWVMDFRGVKCQISEIAYGWILQGQALGAEIEVGWGFGETLAAAQTQAQKGFAATWDGQEKLCANPLQVELSDLPAARDFFAVYPGYQRHLAITETAQEMTLRAAADKYGFFAMWDHIYPIRDFLLFGDIKRAEKALRYMITYPWAETCPWITLHLLVTFNEYLAYSDNRDFVAEAMPFFKRSFEFNQKFVNPETGLLALSLNCGVDCSQEVGLDGLFYPACLNGWWYDALRVLENFALETNAADLASQAGAIIDQIEQHYVATFFDAAEGYLISAVKLDGSRPEVVIYQNTHTIGLDYAYGEYLMRQILPQLANYQATKLYHPTGHCAVAYDSEVPFEMWKAVHMNQHLGHECKCARWGGSAREAERVMQGYLDYFSRSQCAIETFNLAGCRGDVDQQANWQAFSATGAAQALVAGVAGWTCHRGGWNWSWGDNTTAQITALAGKNFAVTGAGNFATGLYLDEVYYGGTMQIPGDVQVQNCRVERTAQAPTHPVLLQALDLSVQHLTLTSARLTFTVQSTRHSYLKLYAPRRPKIQINGQEVNFEWQDARHLIWLDWHFKCGDQVQIS